MTIRYLRLMRDQKSKGVQFYSMGNMLLETGDVDGTAGHIVYLDIATGKMVISRNGIKRNL